RGLGQAEGAGTAADVQQATGAVEVHAGDESVGIVAAERLAVHRQGVLVPLSGRFGSIGRELQVLAIAFCEVDVSEAHGGSRRSGWSAAAFDGRSAPPAGHTTRPGAAG